MWRNSIFDRPFGSLFREMEEEMADMERRMDRLLRQATNEGNGRTGRPYVWGYSVNVGPDGVPRVQQFGNVGQEQKQLEEGWREPFCTTVVDDEQDVVRVTAELPGVTKDDIDVETLADRVRIEAKGTPWNYRADVPIRGVQLDTESAKARYNNGILELTIQLAEPIRPKGKKVKVE